MTLPPISPTQFSFEYIRELIGPDARVILEIGANDGGHTAKLLALFPKATIYAFEPDPRAAAKFKATISNPRAHLTEIAIGSADGEAEFHVSSGLPTGAPPEIRVRYPTGWDRSGSLHAPKTHAVVWPWVKFERTIRVPVQTLDNWARGHGVAKVDLIWADVQGAEGDLIIGGQATLSRTRYFFTEYSNDEWYEGQPTLAQIVEMLPDFEIVRRYELDVLLANTAVKST